MIIGIDPSLTGSAVAWLEGSGTIAQQLKCVRFTSEASGHMLAARFTRFQSMVNKIIGQCNHVGARTVLIEAYSFGSKGRGLTDLCEFGGLLRMALMQRFKVYEVPPSTVKKFASGVGNADKMRVALDMAKRWDVRFDTSDEFDSAACCLLGHAALDGLPLGDPAASVYKFTSDQLKVAAEALRPTKKAKVKA